MFKKPLGNLKTSAPLRSSDRRKLKQRVVQSFSLSAEEGDVLVPDGLLSVKFNTYSDDPGVAYLAPGGDPLWFTIGKGSDDLIPTVYTLWKKPDLLPFLSTPSAVIPKLIGGADLMIPGVIQHTPSIKESHLVSVTEYTRDKLGPPLAVGRMAAHSDIMGREDAKGKAVYVMHAWKDHLWDMGSKGEPPDPVSASNSKQADAPHESVADDNGSQRDAEHKLLVEGQTDTPASPSGEVTSEVRNHTLSREEVTTILRKSVLQAIQKLLSELPASSFPLSATVFYSTYILPSRPAFISEHVLTTPIDIKHSTHKSLTTFLKVCEKEGLIKLKDMKSEVLVMGVFPTHDDVEAHRPYTSLKDLELKREKQDGKVEEERKKVKEMIIVEKWKPHQQSLKFFQGVGLNISLLYTLPDIKSAINKHAADASLIKQNDQQLIRLDELLNSVLSSKSDELPQFMKREELVKRLSDKMQSWYEITADGKDPVLKKGQLKSILVVVKMRQGRKASTLITNFEPYFLVAESLADELRHICASATSVSPALGKGSGMEVFVQGKQIKAVTELLVSRGIPKKWIEAMDLSDKKK
ncbi:hypothetical protein SERLA73DRAFT_77454 [Serpula lacrymans var. lacrymans S7.3]|uniref:SUI1 domain-containing protein n=2 Tax=Serpula lacrymans var. lacrymans TaxID=341189 RepID=F8QAC1_SERL3|nr:uncharacterized protein SERLADRAFT_442329 [Serpula lacrymans var. lacrymans S7.9]EGN94711.1 hypothetical protein SERLA73DRAFT_77454 [Serpula lacrymans var. lacrymans S7.3]EGO20190.1 hypothetical protein SERLADRAFT_442329 [Serpula lacrymans var. lacrymans S7.9]